MTEKVLHDQQAARSSGTSSSSKTEVILGSEESYTAFFKRLTSTSRGTPGMAPARLIALAFFRMKPYESLCTKSKIIQHRISMPFFWISPNPIWIHPYFWTHPHNRPLSYCHAFPECLFLPADSEDHVPVLRRSCIALLPACV